MRTLLLGILFTACATVSCATVNPNSYQESVECPVDMTRAQYDSGAVRCRAECGAWGREYLQYLTDCRCVCKGAKGSSPYIPPGQM